jgi:hypothetical protein
MGTEFLEHSRALRLRCSPIEPEKLYLFTFKGSFYNVEEGGELAEYDGFGEWFLFT